MDLKELLEKGFNAGYNTSVLYNCGSCEGAFESFEDWFESVKSLLPIVSGTFKEKHTPNFKEFMTNFCKHGITLTNNYTRETISLKDLIRKYKLTNNIKS